MNTLSRQHGKHRHVSKNTLTPSRQMTGHTSVKGPTPSRIVTPGMMEYFKNIFGKRNT